MKRGNASSLLDCRIESSRCDLDRYRMCWVGRAERDEARTVRPIAQAGYEVGYLETANISWADNERGRGPTGTAIRTGKPAIYGDIAVHPAFAPWREEAMRRGYASAIALPLIIDRRTFGAMTIYAPEADAFNEDAVRLLIELSHDLAFGISALRARARVETEHARLESILMHAPIAVAVYAGPDHVVRLANSRWFELGKRVGPGIGRPLREVLPEATAQGVIAALDEVYASGNPRQLKEFPLVFRRSGRRSERRLFDVALEPLRDSDGSVSDIIVVILDVTERVAAQEAAEEARAAADQANRAKDAFLRIASHELRTPLTPILGWAQLLKNDPKREPNRIERGIDVILRSARLEAQLVEDLIDVSRIVAGTMRMDRRPIELGPLVQACVDEARAAGADKSVEFAVAIAPDTALTGDARRLQQVVRNLLSNALKFTPPAGRISVEVVRAGGSLQLRVHDTGKGIAADDLQHVFEPFRQGDASTTRAERGLGLGLSIVRYIVEAHGGSVRAESAGAGHGATLIVELTALA